MSESKKGQIEPKIHVLDALERELLPGELDLHRLGARAGSLQAYIDRHEGNLAPNEVKLLQNAAEGILKIVSETFKSLEKIAKEGASKPQS